MRQPSESELEQAAMAIAFGVHRAESVPGDFFAWYDRPIVRTFFRGAAVSYLRLVAENRPANPYPDLAAADKGARGPAVNDPSGIAWPAIFEATLGHMPERVDIDRARATIVVRVRADEDPAAIERLKNAARDALPIVATFRVEPLEDS